MLVLPDAGCPLQRGDRPACPVVNLAVQRASAGYGVLRWAGPGAATSAPGFLEATGARAERFGTGVLCAVGGPPASQSKGRPVQSRGAARRDTPSGQSLVGFIRQGLGILRRAFFLRDVLRACIEDGRHPAGAITGA